MYCSTGSGDDDADGDYEYVDVSGGIKTSSSSGDNVLCGITSLGIGCGDDGKYKPIYTNVINYVEWIQEHTGTGACK